MTNRKTSLLAILFAYLTLSAQAYTIDEIARADRVLQLMKQRLEISELVARAKWNLGLPIEDRQREAVVVERFVALARENQIPTQFARGFITAQIEASKLVQARLIRRWRADRRPPFEQAPDLARDIRPQLDHLTSSLIEALKDSKKIDPKLLNWRAGILWGNKLCPAQEAALNFAAAGPTRDF